MSRFFDKCPKPIESIIEGIQNKFKQYWCALFARVQMSDDVEIYQKNKSVYVDLFKLKAQTKILSYLRGVFKDVYKRKWEKPPCRGFGCRLP